MRAWAPPRGTHLAQQQDEGGEVEHIHHPHEPVQKHGGARGGLEAQLAVFQSGIKHFLSQTEQVSQGGSTDICQIHTSTFWEVSNMAVRVGSDVLDHSSLNAISWCHKNTYAMRLDAISKM